MAGAARLAIEIVSDADTAAREFGTLGAAAGTAETKVAGLGRAIDDAGRRTSNFGAGTADRLDAIGGGAGRSAAGLNDLAGAVEAVGFGPFADGMGVASIAMEAAAGASDLFVVGQKLVKTVMESTRVQMAISAASTTAYNVQQAVAAGAARVWTVAQAALNVVLSLNPIGLVVIAIAALVAGIILAYKNSETFRNIVDGAFRAVVSTAQDLWGWITRVADAIGGTLSNAFNTVRGGIDRFVGIIKDAIRFVQDLIDKVRNVANIKLPFGLGSLANRNSLGGNASGFALTREGRAADVLSTLDRLASSPTVVNVFLDGKRISGVIERVIAGALDDDGARLADGTWG